MLKLYFFQAKKKEQESEQDWDNWFSEQDKELQQIFQGQSAMREVLTDLHKKMDEIITRQERTLTLVQQVIWLFVKKGGSDLKACLYYFEDPARSCENT